MFKASHFYPHYSFRPSLTISFSFLFSSCNLTCESGQFGVNCAQTCPCHDKNCNPVSGACNLCKNNFLFLDLPYNVWENKMKAWDSLVWRLFWRHRSILGGLRRTCGVSHHLFFSIASREMTDMACFLMQRAEWVSCKHLKKVQFKTESTNNNLKKCCRAQSELVRVEWVNERVTYAQSRKKHGKKKDRI